MQELLAIVLSYAQSTWRYRWVVLVTAWLVAVIGWAIVAQLPDKYRANARIFVDTNSVLQPLLQGVAIQPDFGQRVALMSRILLTRPNLEKIIRMSDIDLSIESEKDKEKVFADLKSNLQLGGERSHNSMYRVSYENVEPALAKRVVQSAITVFVEGALGEHRGESVDAQKFLIKQIAAYEQRLAEAEKRLADFKRENVGMLGGSAEGYYSRMETAKTQLEAAELELKEAQNRRDDVKKQLEDGGEEFAAAFIKKMKLENATPLDARVNALRENLDRLLLKYTELHPDVKETRRMIAALTEQRQRELEAEGGYEGLVSAGRQTSPVYQQMRVMLSEADAQVAAMQARVQAYQQQVEELAKKTDAIPKVEAKLKQLDRDYGTIKGQYATLLQRRESAFLSEEVEKTAEDIKFRVVDPPRVPLEPSAPNRVVLNTGVFFGAISGGLALGFFLALLTPVFNSGRELSTKTGLPLLGVVTLVDEPNRSVKRRLLFVPFTALSVGLVVAYAVVIIV
jgi:polysaccharide chain length determinant protein (PEP-CTERM system associated)